MMVYHPRMLRPFRNGRADPVETREWLDSLSSVVHHAGRERGLHLLSALGLHARNLGVAAPAPPYSPYRNTIALADAACPLLELPAAVVSVWKRRKRDQNPFGFVVSAAAIVPSDRRLLSPEVGTFEAIIYLRNPQIG